MIGTLHAESTTHLRLPPATLAEIGRKPYDAGAFQHFAELAQFAVHLRPRSQIVEYGCGDGWLVEFLCRCGHNACGVETNPEWARQARARGVPVIEADWEQLAEEQVVDAVLWNNSLHHALNPAAMLRRSFAALKPGGLSLVSEPGLGHSLRPSTRAWHRLTGVTERDTPPLRTAWLGWRAGFRRIRVHPNLNTLARIQPRLGPCALPLVLGKWLHGFVRMERPL
jgi:SAM-dependent methyltransferase